MKKQYIIPIFVPHLGCPNDCVFCNQKSISGQKSNMTKEKAKKIIDDYLESIKDEVAEIEIAFFGGSFTAIEKEKQEELLKVAYEYIKNGKVESIRVSTRPDCIDKETLKRLKKYGVKTIELGVQSANDYILKKANRGHTFADVKKASKMIRWNGFKLGHQMMVGLPESTRIDEINTAKALVKLKPKMVRIYPVLVIKNTKLEEEYKEGKYQPLSVVQAVEICKDIVRIFADKNIDILIVEDNEELRHFLVNMLQKDYRILEAADGKSGLDLTVSAMPDLIISDIMMPVMDGIELLEAVKKNHDISHIPFILLSAKASLDDRIKLSESKNQFAFETAGCT